MKVLILTASAGNGHNSTAKAFENKLKENGADVKIVDMYKECGTKLQAWIRESGYFFACNHLVGVYNAVFKNCEKRNIDVKYTNDGNKENDSFLYPILKIIYSYQPDAIVCTYFTCGIVLNNLRLKYHIPAKIYCMTLDYGISPYWELCNKIDYMFITDEYMKEQFIKRGFTNEQIVVSGIPISLSFASGELDKKEVRAELGMSKDIPTLLVTRSKMFPFSNRKLIKELNKVEQQLQVIIINGLSKDGKLELDKMIEKGKCRHKVYNYGFVDTALMFKLFSASDIMFGKAGGLTSTESITLGVPLLIIDKIPQQEVRNAEFLYSVGCARQINRKNTLSSTLTDILKDKNTLIEMRENCINLRKPFALQTCVEHILNNAKDVDYTNIDSIDNIKKKIVTKQIVAKRREEHKAYKKRVNTKNV